MSLINVGVYRFPTILCAFSFLSLDITHSFHLKALWLFTRGVLISSANLKVIDKRVYLRVITCVNPTTVCKEGNIRLLFCGRCLKDLKVLKMLANLMLVELA